MIKLRLNISKCPKVPVKEYSPAWKQDLNWDNQTSTLRSWQRTYSISSSSQQTVTSWVEFLSNEKCQQPCTVANSEKDERMSWIWQSNHQHFLEGLSSTRNTVTYLPGEHQEVMWHGRSLAPKKGRLSQCSW